VEVQRQGRMSAESENNNQIVVFSHASPFADVLQLEFRLFDFYGTQMRIHQNWVPDGKGGTDIGFGASVYNGAIVLSYYLERNIHEVGCRN